MINNSYLYNFLLSSYFINYDRDSYSAFLGMEQSLAFYLFSYSQEFFICYEEKLISPHLIVENYALFYSLIEILNHTSNVTDISIQEDQITFQYLNIYKYTIEYIDRAINNNILYSNPTVDLTYNGLSFKSPKIDDTVSYYYMLYSKNPKNLSLLTMASILLGIYYNAIIHNNILTNLLRYGVNIKKMVRDIRKNITFIDFINMRGLAVEDYLIKQRVNLTMDFCYDF